MPLLPITFLIKSLQLLLILSAIRVYYRNVGSNKKGLSSAMCGNTFFPILNQQLKLCLCFVQSLDINFLYAMAGVRWVFVVVNVLYVKKRSKLNGDSGLFLYECSLRDCYIMEGLGTVDTNGIVIINIRLGNFNGK